MPRIQVDGREFPFAPPQGAWRDLLVEIDRELDSRGLLVTDVRFDGLDEPAFRDEPVLARPLDEMATIEVAAATPHHLVSRCLDDAASSLPALAQAARDVGEQFRGFDISGANAALVEFAEGVSTLMGIVAASGSALGVELGTLACGPSTVGARVTELISHVDHVIAAQQQQDWLTVADGLEYDLAPFLDDFGPVLDAFERPSPAA